MPRRKRRNENKAPLVFAESPVHLRRNAFSPIYGAINPVTAKVIPVDETNCTWISPHFRFPVTPSQKKSRRKSNSTIDTGRDNQETVSVHTFRSRRLLPLPFVGDQPIGSVQSFAHQDDAADCKTTRRITRRMSSRRKNYLQSQVEINENLNIPSMVAAEKCHKGHTGVTSPLTNNCLWNENSGRELTAESLFSTVEKPDYVTCKTKQTSAPSAVQSGNKSNTLTCNLVCSPLENLPQGLLDIVTPEVADNTPCELSNHSNFHTDKSEINQKTPLRAELSTQAFSHLNNHSSHVNLQTYNEKNTPRPKACKVKQVVLFKSPIESSNLRCKVGALVDDTPVREYGLTLRQRQIKRLKSDAENWKRVLAENKKLRKL